VYFGKLLLLTLNLKFLHNNDIFWVWTQLTKWRSSTLVSTPSERILILNILLQFELWVYFQCLLNSIYRIIWKFNLHHDVHHRHIHTSLNFLFFEIIFYLIWFFITFSSKIIKRKKFSQKILKICKIKRTCNFIYEK